MRREVRRRGDGRHLCGRAPAGLLRDLELRQGAGGAATAAVDNGRVFPAVMWLRGYLQKLFKFKRYKTNAVFHSMTEPSAAPAASATGEISDAASASDWRPSAIATNGANDVLS